VRGVVAGTIRSTMVAGKLTLCSSQVCTSGGTPAVQSSACSTSACNLGPFDGRLSQLTRAIGPASARQRASSPRTSSPGTVTGGRAEPRSARRSSSSISRPVTGSSRYAFSVTVSVTTRTAGSASSATTASGSAAACRTPVSVPITRVLLPVPSTEVTLNSRSCAVRSATTVAERGATPTVPQFPPATAIACSV
jgi:hypothetical protein